ncbi:MAG: hypothetical protein WAW36_02150 [Methylovulum miyakonense]|uniref:InlB B-repeat-containing protein n=1 Tax=Methylovulum miyakonense TaxID=645578 RepID=UPI003BB7B112
MRNSSFFLIGVFCSLISNVVHGAGSTIVTKPNSGTLQLTATAGAGWVFSNWRGDCQGVAKTITLSMAKGDHNCTRRICYSQP